MPSRDTLQSRGEWRMGFFLNGQQPRAPSLRDLLAGPEPIVAPGAYDALSARLIEAAGFRAVYMTGFGTAASLLGRPDVGLLGMSEMVDNARRIVQAVAVPVIAGADVIFFERSAFASSFFRSARCSPPRAAYAKFSRPFARMARPWQRSPGCRASANSPISSACPKSRSWSSSAACRSKRGVEWQAHLASTA